MFRPSTASKTAAAAVAAAASANSKTNSSNEHSPTTVREIKSRTSVGSTTNSSSPRHLLTNRRQTASMERLNSGQGSIVSSSLSCNDKEKSSPSGGSSNSINGSSSSPQRSNLGLNRTASRVSRFRSAKAVFERLSNSNNNNSTTNRPERLSVPEKPKGTVVSRYAAATAAARANSTNSSPNSTTSSPKSRLPSGRLQESGKSTLNSDISRFSSNHSNSPSHQPRPNPRVITTSRAATQVTVTNSPSNGSNNSRTKPMASSSLLVKAPAPAIPVPTALIGAQVKPPPKDLIDKIVLEIAHDQVPDPDCTIQDLSNCDISGIPETLDFDKCFQDVEMMTEEEARKLLSRKSTSSTTTIVERLAVDSPENISIELKDKAIEPISSSILVGSVVANQLYEKMGESSDELAKIEGSIPSKSGESRVVGVIKCKVRFSEEPVKIFDTHAVEDYDRRNEDIDPIAASAEYEIEKSKEREGLKDSDNEEDYNQVTNEAAIRASDNFMDSQDSSTLCSLSGIPQNLHNAPPRHNDSRDFSADSTVKQQDEDLQSYNKDYIESLEREVNLKRILEQNLRDLQSQYYEAVKELDDYKGVTKTKLTDLENSLNELNSKLGNSQSELTDSREQSNQFEKELNDIKKSSQLLEKKYHRAKKIIKDLQSREETFNRREELFQQKLDEIEAEFGVLANAINKTIHDDGLKYYKIIDNTTCQQKHQVRFDVFSLLKQVIDSFNAVQSAQDSKLKHRVNSILERQLANLMVMTNGTTTATGEATVVGGPPIVSTNKNNSSDIYHSSLTNDDVGTKHGQNSTHQLASHRLSQPNLPHPIGVSGQPTKLFQGLNSMLPISTANEPSPPQSVNSFPSTNSLNSLNNITNNNNNNSSSNNNNIITINNKLRDPPSIGDIVPSSMSSQIVPLTSNSTSDDKFQPTLDIQVPYQTSEWHEKPVSEWTTTQVSTWLLALGLDQYISKFEDRNVNGQSLINLDSTVLKGLGVLNSNDRNLLKKKIRELRAEMEKERKLAEKKLKENLKEKSKNKLNGANRSNNNNSNNRTTDVQQQNNSKSSWKKSLLS